VSAAHRVWRAVLVGALAWLVLLVSCKGAPPAGPAAPVDAGANDAAIADSGVHKRGMGPIGPGLWSWPAGTPSPTLTSSSPDWGLVGGGTVVTITASGGGLSSATGAKVNGQSLTSFAVDSSTQVHGTTPAATGSTAVANTAVSVQGPWGSVSLSSSWTYLPASPTLILLADVGVTGTSPITKWADQSGNSHDFNQNGGLAAPSLVSSVINGKPVVRFASASSQSLEFGDGTLSYPWNQLVTAAAYTYYVLPKWTSSISTNNANSYDNESVFSDAASGELAYTAKSTGPTALAYHWDGADKHADQTISIGTFYLSSVKYDGTNIKHWINGAGLVSTAAGHVQDLGKNPRIGVDYTQARFFNGDLPALLFWNTAHSDADRGVVESWLGHRFGLF